ncbi:hypothetical protein F4777DRAFT_89567 [Nemania sp. FL0916]|nr:hypothetical protein F4777DRAFT_89567 [Nemania sp. FL0916]
MYTKKILSLAALAGASMAQITPAPDCQSKINALLGAAPTAAPELESMFENMGSNTNGNPPTDLLVQPDVYVEELCKFAGSLSPSLLSEFGSYGQELLHFASVSISAYDDIVTNCVTTGAAATSITSYLHSIVSATTPLCQPTPTSSGASNGTASITPYPTSGSGSNGTIPTPTSTTSLIPTAAAARASGMFAGAAAVGGLLGVVALL